MSFNTSKWFQSITSPCLQTSIRKGFMLSWANPLLSCWNSSCREAFQFELFVDVHCSHFLCWFVALLDRCKSPRTSQLATKVQDTVQLRQKQVHQGRTHIRFACSSLAKSSGSAAYFSRTKKPNPRTLKWPSIWALSMSLPCINLEGCQCMMTLTFSHNWRPFDAVWTWMEPDVEIIFGPQKTLGATISRWVAESTLFPSAEALGSIAGFKEQSQVLGSKLGWRCWRWVQLILSSGL